MDELEEYRDRLDNLIEGLKVVKMMITTEIDDTVHKLDDFKYATNLRKRGCLDAWEEELKFLIAVNDQLKSI